jgi:hypothetical protein
MKKTALVIALSLFPVSNTFAEAYTGASQPRPSARAAATPVPAFGIYPGRHSQGWMKFSGIATNDVKMALYRSLQQNRCVHARRP